MRALQPHESRNRLLLAGGVCLFLTGCTLINNQQPNVSAQPPASQQTGAVHFLQEAQDLEQQKKFEEAAAAYASIIEASPDEAEAYEHLIQIHLGLNQLEAAQKVADQYRRQFPAALSPLILQAAAFAQQNHWAEAESVYREGIERFPNNEELLLGLSLALSKQQRLDEAARLIDSKLTKSDQWSATLYALRAQIELNNQDGEVKAKAEALQKAREYLEIATNKSPENAELWLQKYELERAQEDLPAATDSLLKLQKLLPKNTQLIQALVSLYLAQGEYDHVMPQIDLLVKQRDDDAGDLIWLATRHALSADNLEEASTLSERGAQLLPDNVELQFLHAYTLILNRQFAKAEPVLATARKKLYAEQPNSFDPRLELYYGIALLQQHKTAEAESIFTELAAQQFEARIAEYLQLLLKWNDYDTLRLLADVMAHAEAEISESAYLPYFRALILQQEKEYKASVEAFSEAEKKSANLGDKQSTLLNEQFYYAFASSYERCGELNKAETLFRKTLALNPKRADVMNYLAYMWAEHNTHLDEAQELITKALEIEPEMGAFIDTLGWIYYQQGNYQEAMTQLLKASKLDPDDPTVQDHLGDCALKLGNSQEARTYWLKSVEMEPNKKIQDKIDALPSE